jgi:hypothetical protein
MRTLAALLILFSSICYAGVLPSDIRAALVQKALAGFWGNARDSSGMPILPNNDQDLATVPIAPTVVEQAINVGEITGMAEWCGMEWVPQYRALTRYARNAKMTDKQVAFISVLHGVAQQTIVSSMGSRACADQDKDRVRGLLNQSKLHW